MLHRKPETRKIETGPPFNLMEIRFPLDGRAAADSVSLPGGMRIPTPDLDLLPPNRLQDAAGLRRTPGGGLAGGDKFARSLFFRLIHAFRAAHGAPASGLMNSPAYRAVVRRYLRLDAPPDQRPAIDFISSREGFLLLYGAGGRMRHAFNPFSARELAFLCAETRAALIWRAQFD